MTGNSSTNVSAILLEGSFCDTFFDVAGLLSYVSTGFLIVGLVVGLAAAVVGLFRRPANQTTEIAKATDAFLTALKGLIDTLAAAPAWLGMYGAGILLFWVSGEVVPEKCKHLVAEVAVKMPEKPKTGQPRTTEPGANSQNTSRP